MAREKWSSYLQLAEYQWKREEIFGKLYSQSAGPAKAAELCRKPKEGVEDGLYWVKGKEQYKPYRDCYKSFEFCEKGIKTVGRTSDLSLSNRNFSDIQAVWKGDYCQLPDSPRSPQHPIVTAFYFSPRLTTSWMCGYQFWILLLTPCHMRCNGTWKSPVEALRVHFADARDLTVPPSVNCFWRSMVIICVISLSTVTRPGIQYGLPSYLSCQMEIISRTKFLSYFSLKRGGK